MSEDTREWARPMLCGDPEGLERHAKDLIHCARKMREKADEEAADAVEQHVKEMTHDTFSREYLNDPTSLMEDDKPKVGPASLMHILGEAAAEAEEERRKEMDELRKENKALKRSNSLGDPAMTAALKRIKQLESQDSLHPSALARPGGDSDYTPWSTPGHVNRRIVMRELDTLGKDLARIEGKLDGLRGRLVAEDLI